MIFYPASAVLDQKNEDDHADAAVSKRVSDACAILQRLAQRHSSC